MTDKTDVETVRLVCAEPTCRRTAYAPRAHWRNLLAEGEWRCHVHRTDPTIDTKDAA